MFKFAALYILGCPKIFSQMKWDLNERRTCNEKIDFEVSIACDIEKYFSYYKKMFFHISGRSLSFIYYEFSRFFKN